MSNTYTLAVTGQVALGLSNGGNFPVMTSNPILTARPRQYGSGTGAGNLTVCIMQPVIATTSGVSIDLSGSLTDPWGQPAVFTVVKEIELVNTGTVSVTVTGNFMTSSFGASTNGITLPANNGELSWGGTATTGLVVTNAAADVVTLTSGSGTNTGTCSVNVLIVG